MIARSCASDSSLWRRRGHVRGGVGHQQVLAVDPTDGGIAMGARVTTGMPIAIACKILFCKPMLMRIGARSTRLIANASRMCWKCSITRTWPFCSA